MTSRVFAAVDIGASSGRVVAGIVDADHGGRTTLETVHRFPNGARTVRGHLRWDLVGLFGEVLTGLTELARRHPRVESVGIDTWAVDYGLLDADGELLAPPISYRDGRTTDAVTRVHRRIDSTGLYAVNGLQHLPFTTVFQIEAEKEAPLWARAAHLVLLPDLLAYWLTGVLRTEVTNASTTGLLDVRTGAWSPRLLDLLEISPSLLPELERPGAVRGSLLPEVSTATGLSPDTVVTTVGSHDTASAVVALPNDGRPFAYVSSGTWSLAGVELERPVVTEDARAANFTNEGGVDDRTRFLRNIGGLWLLQESLRTWASDGLPVELDGVLAAAERLPAGGPTIDVDDPAFIPPDGMPARISTAVQAKGAAPLTDPAAVTRCIIDSLAAAYARTVEEAGRLSGRPAEVIHVVGGGARNALLCRSTADLSGLPVSAGPVEATALGNVLVQARAHGAAPAKLEELRGQLAAAGGVRWHLPS